MVSLERSVTFSLERIAKLSAQDTRAEKARLASTDIAGIVGLLQAMPSIASIGEQLHLSLDGACHGLLDIWWLTLLDVAEQPGQWTAVWYHSRGYGGLTSTPGGKIPGLAVRGPGGRGLGGGFPNDD